MNEQAFAKYAKIKLQIRELEKEAADLNEVVLNEMKANKLGNYKNEFGLFTVGTKTTYEYSPKVKKLVDNLKVAKIMEEEKGIAKPKATNYLLFTTPKE